MAVHEKEIGMKIVVLASGGVDSSLMMFLLKKEGHEIFPLFIDYGQLAREKEWVSCQNLCHFLELEPFRIDISGFGKSIPSGITDSELDIEKNAFLPTRNLLFLTLGAAYGHVKSANVIAIGILANPIFPDQTPDFVQAAQNSISKALGANTIIMTPLISLDKRDTLRLARKYGLPLDLTSSCHSSSKEPCGHCISCKERLAAEAYLSNKKS
jgi:7-cyano-7-deazaguanine synthase